MPTALILGASRGMLATIAALGRQDSGSFRHYDGSVLPR